MRFGSRRSPERPKLGKKHEALQIFPDVSHKKHETLWIFLVLYQEKHGTFLIFLGRKKWNILDVDQKKNLEHPNIPMQLALRHVTNVSMDWGNWLH